MGYRSTAAWVIALVIAAAAFSGAQPVQPPDTSKKPKAIINPPPTPQDWADLAKLPDWSGVWNPKSPIRIAR